MQGIDEPTLERQREFWNKWNAGRRDPDHLVDWAVIRGHAIMRAVESLRLDRPRILDLGCGTGWLTEKLAAYGQATGIDLSDAVLAKARERCPNIEYIAGDLFEAQLPQAHFDLVVSQDVVAHVIDQSGYIAIAARALKQGGHLIITSTNRFVVTRMDLPPQPPEHIERWLDMRSFRRLLQSHFDIIRTTTVMPMGSRGVLRLINSGRLQSLLRPLISPQKLAAAKERLGLGYNMIAVARKRR